MKTRTWLLLVSTVIFLSCASSPESRYLDSREDSAEPSYQEITFLSFRSAMQDRALPGFTTDSSGMMVNREGFDRQIYITEAYINRADSHVIFMAPTPITTGAYGQVENRDAIRVHFYASDDYPRLRDRIRSEERYLVHIANGRFGPGVVRIEGDLVSMDELSAIDERVRTEREAEQAAQREIAAARDAYDPDDFTLLPERFQPSQYEEVDLFDAAVIVGRMPRGGGGILDELFASRRFVSDVVFVNQRGTNIVFETSDGAASKVMEIGSRSGLEMVQEVRLYYVVTKNPLTQWRVEAIQPLTAR